MQVPKLGVIFETKRTRAKRMAGMSKRIGRICGVYHTPKLAPNQMSEKMVVPLVMSRALSVRASKAERPELQLAHWNSTVR
jgi:hypothetical protein